MKSISFACLPVFLCAFATSCKPKETPPGTPQVSALALADMPLLKVEPGDFWTYRVHIEMPAGVTSPEAAAVDSTHERVRTFLGKVPFVKDKPDVDCFEVIAPHSPPDREYVNIFDDRIELVGELVMKDAGSHPIVFPSPVVFVKAGIQAGEPMGIPAEVAGRQRGGSVIGREEVEVPAGKFKAIRLLTSGMDGAIESRRTIWFSPGNGIVKVETVRYAQGHVKLKETQELSAKGHKPVEDRPKGDAPH